MSQLNKSMSLIPDLRLSASLHHKEALNYEQFRQQQSEIRNYITSTTKKVIQRLENKSSELIAIDKQLSYHTRADLLTAQQNRLNSTDKKALLEQQQLMQRKIKSQNQSDIHRIQSSSILKRKIMDQNYINDLEKQVKLNEKKKNQLIKTQQMNKQEQIKRELNAPVLNVIRKSFHKLPVLQQEPISIVEQMKNLLDSGKY
ncbi:Hypothetical_protein [Hexamita inflata]|uniref:Hypothetical_protein n=1 Tax=Hexamita inflata TaxID=28002 RepID=A0AA86U4W5_9EUKA|nr:Hypothetical protein HINF_LOCUS30390 [Hexamita inflata]